MNENEPAPAPLPRPWFTVELDGVVLHVPIREGETFTIPMTAEGLYALIGEGAEQLAKLKADPNLQKTLLTKGASLLVDWLAKKR